MRSFLYTSFIVMTFLLATSLSARTVIKLSPSEKDQTVALRNLLERSDDDILICLEKGTYHFSATYATEKYCTVTNHGNGSKRIIFNLEGKNSLKIEGNGADILCHGRVFPFRIFNCSDVDICDLSIDWDIPYLFQAEVMNVDEKSRQIDIKPYSDGFSWNYRQGSAIFPGVDEFNYTCLGSTIAFDRETKDIAAGAKDAHIPAQVMVKIPGGLLRMKWTGKKLPEVGQVIVSKGDRENDRYAPAFGFHSCDDVHLENVTVHHALGMAYLFERCSDIVLENSRVCLKEGTGRLVSSTADATHFASCKGKILVKDCLFQNMLDDGTNVHGSYVKVDRLTGMNSLIAELVHYEQEGSVFGTPGDQVWFLHKPSTHRTDLNKISEVKVLNEKYMELTFTEPLAQTTQPGDLIENKTWNAEFTMKGCEISHHRARNIVIKTPCKTLIEGNTLSSMMSSILLRGEGSFWYESGAVSNVLIRKNHFLDCAELQEGHSVLLISPRFNKDYKIGDYFDKNIRFIGNTIEGSNPTIVNAAYVNGLVIKDNLIMINSLPVSNYNEFKTDKCYNCYINNNTVIYE